MCLTRQDLQPRRLHGLHRLSCVGVLGHADVLSCILQSDVGQMQCVHLGRIALQGLHGGEITVPSFSMWGGQNQTQSTQSRTITPWISVICSHRQRPEARRSSRHAGLHLQPLHLGGHRPVDFTHQLGLTTHHRRGVFWVTWHYQRPGHPKIWVTKKKGGERGEKIEN